MAIFVQAKVSHSVWNGPARTLFDGLTEVLHTVDVLGDSGVHVQLEWHL